MSSHPTIASSTALEAPVMQAPRRITADWTMLGGWAPLPGLGAIAVNSFLLKGKEPVLVDTGMAPFADGFMAALEQEIDLEDLAWIWISHADVDHIGALQRVLDRAPRAKVVTGFLGIAKLGLMGFDLGRVRLLEPGAAFEAGGRRLHPVRPLYFDAPESTGFYDPQAELLFVVDCFGAVLPAPAPAVEDLAEGDLRAGMLTWSSIDAPWLRTVDPLRFGRGLATIERLAPRHLASAHLPLLGGKVTTLTRPIAEAYCTGPAAKPDPLHIETALAAFDGVTGIAA